MRHGTILVSFSAVVAARNKLISTGHVRILADLDSKPRVIRIIVDKAGAFGVRKTRGDAAVVVLGKLSGLEKVRFEKTDVEWEEDEDGSGNLMIDVILPNDFQPTDLPQSAGAGRPAAGTSLVADKGKQIMAEIYGNGRAHR